MTVTYANAVPVQKTIIGAFKGLVANQLGWEEKE